MRKFSTYDVSNVFFFQTSLKVGKIILVSVENFGEEFGHLFQQLFGDGHCQRWCFVK